MSCSARSLLLLGLCAALPACGTLGDDARLAPPVEAGAEDQRRFALTRGPATDVSVMVEERNWSASTKRILIQHTPLFIEVRNTGALRVRYRAEDIVLEVGDDGFEAIDVTRLVRDADPGLDELRIAKTEGIRGATLDPGDEETGFVFFRKKLSEDDPDSQHVAVTISLYDEDHAELLEVIRIPMEVIPQ